MGWARRRASCRDDCADGLLAGYVAMAKHITTTGAFYGFISHGLGQVWGMASGLLSHSPTSFSRVR